MQPGLLTGWTIYGVHTPDYGLEVPRYQRRIPKPPSVDTWAQGKRLAGLDQASYPVG